MVFHREGAVLFMIACGAAAPSTADAASAILRWTAPGDDSLSGRATSYDIRYSTSPISVANFGAATAVKGLPAPGLPGARESWIVSGLDATRNYFFAMRTVDDRGNWSSTSNLAFGPPSGTVAVADAAAPLNGLSTPWPNPARTRSRLVLSLATAADVEVSVFDSQGRRLHTLLRGHWPAGETTVIWDLSDARGGPASAGLYHVRARVGDEVFRRTISVVR